MPTWKRLTTTSGNHIAINTDAVAFIHASSAHSTVYFAFAGEHGKPHSVIVKNSIDDILAGDKSAPPAT